MNINLEFENQLIVNINQGRRQITCIHHNQIITLSLLTL